MRRRFPTALIAGVSKGGTTTLLRFLNAHPEIAARDGKLPENRYTAYFVQNEKTSEWYRNLMPCSNADQITVERSPAYFNCNKCPQTISEFNSNMKLIFIFREPTDRAFSQYQMAKRTFIDRNRTFEESVLSTNLKQVKNNSFYIFVSRYQDHVKRWLNMFSLDQMLFLDGLTFVSSPSDALNSVEDFLGIERFFTKDMFTRGRNGKFCLSMDDVDLKCPPSTKGLLHQSMKNSTRRTLEAYFKPLNTEFFQLINKRFEWGY
jgi:[heparan sulfate]-glucosamine 3-sulfotransferase 1/[heparan sulfate]-glucosamine 3-sulfotransferase 5